VEERPGKKDLKIHSNCGFKAGSRVKRSVALIYLLIFRHVILFSFLYLTHARITRSNLGRGHEHTRRPYRQINTHIFIHYTTPHALSPLLY